MDGKETDVDYSVEVEEHIQVLANRVNELNDPVNHAKIPANCVYELNDPVNHARRSLIDSDLLLANVLSDPEVRKRFKAAIMDCESLEATNTSSHDPTSNKSVFST